MLFCPTTGIVTQPNNKTKTELILSTENHWWFAYKRAAAISRKRIRTTLRSVKAVSIGRTLVFSSIFTCIRDIGNFGTSQGLCRGYRNNLRSQYSYNKKKTTKTLTEIIAILYHQWNWRHHARWKVCFLFRIHDHSLPRSWNQELPSIRHYVIYLATDLAFEKGMLGFL